ncbi:MAG: hydroxyacylglutathione hydrolase [Alphaproteobacteria bacterium]|nr:hydroxyacylglutathione hydrolase [Alphaproteobacteria bacterium]
MPFDVVRVPCFNDNYVWIVRETASGMVAAVDPADPAPVGAALAQRDWRLTHILNTHHHADHVGGNLALKAATGCTIVGPRADEARIPGIDVALADGARWSLGAEEAVVFDVPGHTRGHIAFWFGGARALFCGDTLFLLGCGRLFEGTPAQMWTSLGKLRALPDDTLVYCAHEYTQSNARFARHADPDNAALARRSAEIDAMRARGEATVPAPLGLEKATNPFLRADDPALARAHGFDGRDPVAVFAHLRKAKDGFR